MLRMQTKEKEKNDLELYFEEPCYPNVLDFDALFWWKGNEGKYKVLSRMAMDILSIPITTVASEFTFSAGGRVIDKKRASMRQDTVEVLLCGGDWIKEAYGLRSIKDGNDDPIELEHEKDPSSKDANQDPGKQVKKVQPSKEVTILKPTKQTKLPGKKVVQTRSKPSKSRRT